MVNSQKNKISKKFQDSSMENSQNSEVFQEISKDSSNDDPHKKEAPNETSSEEENLVSIPEEWSKHNFQDLYEAGWKPRIKRTRGQPYISLYKGSKNKGLGPYDEERWSLINNLFPQKISKTVPSSNRAKFPITLMGTTMKRGDWVPKTFTPTVDTLKWFETLKITGSPVGFDEFINDIVETHFTQCHGLKFRIVKTEHKSD